MNSDSQNIFLTDAFNVFEEKVILYYIAVLKIIKIPQAFIFSRTILLSLCKKNVGQPNKVVANLCMCAHRGGGCCDGGSTWPDKNAPMCYPTTIQQHHRDI